MEKTSNKISIKQAITISLMAIFATIIRVIPKYCAEYAKEGTWLTVFVGVVPFLFLIYVLSSLMKNGKELSLEYAFENILGKWAGRVLTFIYILVLLLILAIQVRFFAEKFCSSVFHRVPIVFFAITILLATQIIVRADIQKFARFMEVIFPIVIIFIVVVFLMSISSVELKNLYPVTTYHIPGILKSTYPLMRMAGALTYMLFIGNKISDRKNFKKEAKHYTIFLVIVSLAIIISTIGSFGYKLIQNLSLPYFMVIKNIKILSVIERIESVGITFWTITDFAMIAMVFYIVTELLQKQFKLKERKYLVTPITFIGFILTISISANVFELEKFSKGPMAVVYIITGYIIPVILWIIGKIRKVI